MKETNLQWQGRTDGGEWMLHSLAVMLRFLPLWLLYGVVDVVVVFYLIFSRQARQAQYDFYRKRLWRSRLQAILSVYLNMRQFGKVIIDRFAQYAGKRFSLLIKDKELVEDVFSQDRPLVLLTAHIGNFEMAGYNLKPKTKHIYAVMYGREKAEVMKQRESQFSRNKLTILTPDYDGYLLKIKQALSNNDVLIMYADRLFMSKKSVRTQVLDANVNLPMGPFRTALLYPANIVAAFLIRTGYGHYRLLFSPISGSTAEEIAQAYSEALTSVARQYPYQWFNFYHFFV